MNPLYINIANAYRAGSITKDSEAIYKRAFEISDSINSNLDLAALYNNYALLKQEENDHLEAIKYLNMALPLIKDNEIKLGVTYTNLSLSYLNLNELNYVKANLELAGNIFNNNLDDFHISGYYNALGKYYYLNNDYTKSIKYYKLSLAHIDKNIGRGKIYYDTLDNLLDSYNKLGIVYNDNLIELSRNYFKEYKNILFSGIEDLSKITVGLFGLGSECYNLADRYSEDHDYEVGLIVLSDDKNKIEKLKDNYNKLPKIYDRFYIRDNNRHGVFNTHEYLMNYLGFNSGDKLTKSLITNGAIFYGDDNIFTSLRRNYINELTDNYLERIAILSLEINQYYYNLDRSLKRNDNDTFKLLLNHLNDKLIEYIFVYNKSYLPHDKLIIPMLKRFKENPFKDYMDDLYNNKNSILNFILNELYKYNIILKKDSIYIEDYKNEISSFIQNYEYRINLINRIVNLEREQFTNLKNIGSRAICQDNYDYFKIMRKSQALSFDVDLLISYQKDLINAKNGGYSLPEIKYAFMMESTNPDIYENIKERLPNISDKQNRLIESIVITQVEQMEEFINLNPNNRSLMRTIRKDTDNENNTSYETYLRGELKSYSENTLFLYGRNLARIAGIKNYPELIVNYSKLLNK